MKGLADGIRKSRGMVQDAMKQVSADMVITPQMNMAGAFDGNGVMAENLSNNTSILNPILDAISQLKGNEGGDTIIPVYIGETAFEESDILSGSFTLSGQCSDTSNVQIGQVYITELKMTLVNKQKFDRYTLKGAQLIPSFGLRVASGFYEYVPLGVFTINQASWGCQWSRDHCL